MAKDSLDCDYMHRLVELRWEEEQKRPAASCLVGAKKTLVRPDEVNANILDHWWLREENVYVGANPILPERERYPYAKMVLQSYEAPSLYPANDFARYDGLIDYTMGYRLDSDIVRTSGAVHFKLNSEKLKNDVLQNPNPHPMKKRRMAAWLTKVLQQHGLQVDIYGACGSLQCGTKRTEECYKMVEQEYKFYLSFENSLCNHYVTEKFFTLLRYDVVPVTYGLGQELTGAPKDAYIDVFDFPDVQTLAAYLLYLDSNATAYNEYFRYNALANSNATTYNEYFRYNILAANCNATAYNE
ncbi:hypothetical protein HAZT_HAZT010087 [Hyalella azteca]|uniref:Fucosyltransferase n=1 Tax=Hyalella azteca TaxID=294128 RepID=A0A6A0H2E0_HYAAZ|nr:hypothetical protein HAZT_HAZT010087 [Hyalella azteca]